MPLRRIITPCGHVGRGYVKLLQNSLNCKVEHQHVADLVVSVCARLSGVETDLVVVVVVCRLTCVYPADPDKV
jgi:hypothetical protein